MPICRRCGNTTPIITKTAPVVLSNVISSPMKIAANKNPKGITNTRNKLAIPTGIWRIAWLYKKKGIASEKTKYTKVIIVPDEA